MAEVAGAVKIATVASPFAEGAVTATAPLAAEGVAGVAATAAGPAAAEGSKVIATATLPEGFYSATTPVVAEGMTGEISAVEKLTAELKNSGDPESTMQLFVDGTLTGDKAPVDSDKATVTEEQSGSDGRGSTVGGVKVEDVTVRGDGVSGETSATAVENPSNSQTEIDQKITEKMIGWDEDNEVPTEEKEYREYLKDRAEAERNITVEARVDSELDAWKKQYYDENNQNASDEQIAAKKAELTKKHNKKYDRELKENMKKYRKEHDEEMSAAEFAQKVEELQQLQVAIELNRQAIRLMNTIPTQERDSNHDARLRAIEIQIKKDTARVLSLQAELRVEAARTGGPAWKRMLLPMLLAFTIAAPALEKADKEGAQ